MDRAAEHLRAMVPALLFLFAGVPLAALLDRLGYFDAVAVTIERRFAHIPVVALWWLAAVTTAVLNLDTTVVLLTPLYVRLARRADVDPLPVAVIPLLLASLASSVLPVSNLTTLIVADRYRLTVPDVLVHLAPVSVVASVVGWHVYRRRHPTTLLATGDATLDRRALRIGTTVVVGVLVGFVLGPRWSVPPWLVAVGADVVLIAVTRWLPWRALPFATGALVSALAVATAFVVPAGALASVLSQDGRGAGFEITLIGAGVANVTNNIPALLVALDGCPTMTNAMWAWLAGVNTGAVLLPLGALANLLWWRIVRDEGVAIDPRRYVAIVLPIAVPALLAGAIVEAGVLLVVR